MSSISDLIAAARKRAEKRPVQRRLGAASKEVKAAMGKLGEQGHGEDIFLDRDEKEMLWKAVTFDRKMSVASAAMPEFMPKGDLEPDYKRTSDDVFETFSPGYSVLQSGITRMQAMLKVNDKVQEGKSEPTISAEVTAELETPRWKLLEEKQFLDNKNLTQGVDWEFLYGQKGGLASVIAQDAQQRRLNFNKRKKEIIEDIRSRGKRPITPPHDEKEERRAKAMAVMSQAEKTREKQRLLNEQRRAEAKNKKKSAEEDPALARKKAKQQKLLAEKKLQNATKKLRHANLLKAKEDEKELSEKALAEKLAGKPKEERKSARVSSLDTRRPSQMGTSRGAPQSARRTRSSVGKKKESSGHGTAQTSLGQPNDGADDGEDSNEAGEPSYVSLSDVESDYDYRDERGRQIRREDQPESDTDTDDDYYSDISDHSSVGDYIRKLLTLTADEFDDVEEGMTQILADLGVNDLDGTEEDLIEVLQDTPKAMRNMILRRMKREKQDRMKAARRLARLQMNASRFGKDFKAKFDKKKRKKRAMIYEKPWLSDSYDVVSKEETDQYEEDKEEFKLGGVIEMNLMKRGSDRKAVLHEIFLEYVHLFTKEKNIQTNDLFYCLWKMHVLLSMSQKARLISEFDSHCNDLFEVDEVAHSELVMELVEGGFPREVPWGHWASADQIAALRALMLKVSFSTIDRVEFLLAAMGKGNVGKLEVEHMVRGLDITKDNTRFKMDGFSELSTIRKWFASTEARHRKTNMQKIFVKKASMSKLRWDDLVDAMQSYVVEEHGSIVDKLDPGETGYIDIEDLFDSYTCGKWFSHAYTHVMIKKIEKILRAEDKYFSGKVTPPKVRGVFQQLDIYITAAEFWEITKEACLVEDDPRTVFISIMKLLECEVLRILLKARTTGKINTMNPKHKHPIKEYIINNSTNVNGKRCITRDFLKQCMDDEIVVDFAYIKAHSGIEPHETFDKTIVDTRLDAWAILELPGVIWNEGIDVYLNDAEKQRVEYFMCKFSYVSNIGFQVTFEKLFPKELHYRAKIIMKELDPYMKRYFYVEDALNAIFSDEVLAQYIRQSFMGKEALERGRAHRVGVLQKKFRQYFQEFVSPWDAYELTEDFMAWYFMSAEEREEAGERFEVYAMRERNSINTITQIMQSGGNTTNRQTTSRFFGGKMTKRGMLSTRQLKSARQQKMSARGSGTARGNAKRNKMRFKTPRDEHGNVLLDKDGNPLPKMVVQVFDENGNPVEEPSNEEIEKEKKKKKKKKKMRRKSSVGSVASVDDGGDTEGVDEDSDEEAAEARRKEREEEEALEEARKSLKLEAVSKLREALTAPYDYSAEYLEGLGSHRTFHGDKFEHDSGRIVSKLYTETPLPEWWTGAFTEDSPFRMKFMDPYENKSRFDPLDRIEGSDDSDDDVRGARASNATWGRRSMGSDVAEEAGRSSLLDELGKKMQSMSSGLDAVMSTVGQIRKFRKKAKKKKAKQEAKAERRRIKQEQEEAAVWDLPKDEPEQEEAPPDGLNAQDNEAVEDALNEEQSGTEEEEETDEEEEERNDEEELAALEEELKELEEEEEENASEKAQSDVDNAMSDAESAGSVASQEGIDYEQVARLRMEAIEKKKKEKEEERKKQLELKRIAKAKLVARRKHKQDVQKAMQDLSRFDDDTDTDDEMEEETLEDFDVLDNEQEPRYPIPSRVIDMMHKLWKDLSLPNSFRIDMVIKYTTNKYPEDLENAVNEYNKILDAVYIREDLVLKIRENEDIVEDSATFEGFMDASSGISWMISSLLTNHGEQFIYQGEDYITRMNEQRIELCDVVSKRTLDQERLAKEMEMKALLDKQVGLSPRPEGADTLEYLTTPRH